MKFLLKIKSKITIWVTEWVIVTQSCLTLCNPMDYSLPDSSVHGIFQSRILEWVATPFSRETSQPRDQAQVLHIAGRLFTTWATGAALNYQNCHTIQQSHFWIYRKEMKLLRWRDVCTVMLLSVTQCYSQPHPSTENWIKDLLSMAPPMRARPSFPLQSLVRKLP